MSETATVEQALERLVFEAVGHLTYQGEDSSQATRWGEAVTSEIARLRQHDQDPWECTCGVARRRTMTLREELERLMTREPEKLNPEHEYEELIGEACAAVAESARLGRALTEIYRRTGLLLDQTQGRLNISNEHERRIVDVLTTNQRLAAEALAGPEEAK